MNVLFVVFAVLLPAVFVFIFPVVVFDLLPFKQDTAGSSDESRLQHSVLSRELQSRMQSFLSRNSAVDKATSNEFVIASRSSATQTHGLNHLILLAPRVGSKA